jgi:dienelactone hydrolase
MNWLALLFVSFEVFAQGLPGSERVEFGGIVGYLYRPAVTGRTPAIVIVHGSGGVTTAREGFWASELSREGMAALVTDSFTPRGVSTTVEDQSRVSQGQMVRDAYAALAYLASLPDVDGARVAVMGFSKGGGVALISSDRRTRPDARGFAAHIPLYPACSVQYRNPQPTAPLLILIGAADNYTGVKTCAQYVERMRAAGGAVELKTYPGAHHGFDGDTMYQREFFLAGAQNFRDCVLYIEDDGRTVSARGERIESSKQAFDVLRRECMTSGATVAANHGAKMQALQDVKAFLKTTLFH